MSTHKPGYLYAVIAEGGDPRRVKLGSTGAEDPVWALKQSYDRGYGMTQILWLVPCADMRRDEQERMHDYFSDRRVWQAREIFSFDSLEEFQDEIETFEAFLDIWLGDEPRPDVVRDLQTPTGAMAATRRARHRERQRDKKQEAAMQKQRQQEAEAEQFRRQCAKRRQAKRACREAAARHAEEDVHLWMIDHVEPSAGQHMTLKDAHAHYRTFGGRAPKGKFKQRLESGMQTAGHVFHEQSTRMGKKVKNFWADVNLSS